MSTSAPVQEASEVDVLAAPGAGSVAVRGGVIRIAGYGAGLLLYLGTVPFLTRHLGVAGFGGYLSVVSLITIAGLISDAGLTVVGIREYAVLDAGGREKLLRNLLALRVTIAFIGMLGATAFALIAGYSDQLVVGTVLAGLGLVLLVAQQTYTIPLSAGLRLGLVTALDVSRQAMTAAGILLLVALGGTVVTFLAIPIPVGVAVVGMTALAIRLTRSLRPELDWSQWRYLIRETLPVAVASTIGSFFYRAAIIVMSVSAAKVQTGYFSASFRAIEAILMIPGLVCASVFPVLVRAARDDEDRLAYGLQRLFEIGLIVGGWIALSIVLGARPVIDFLAGGHFGPSVPVLRIQGIAIVASFLVAVWATGLWAVRGQRELAIANVVGVSTAATLTALLAPTHGAMGAAIAMTSAEALLAGLYAVALMRRRPKLRVSLGVLPRVLPALALAGTAWFLPLPDLALVFVATGVYFGVLIALGAIPPEVWAVLTRRRPPAAQAQAVPPA